MVSPKLTYLDIRGGKAFGSVLRIIQQSEGNLQAINAIRQRYPQLTRQQAGDVFSRHYRALIKPPMSSAGQQTIPGTLGATQTFPRLGVFGDVTDRLRYQVGVEFRNPLTGHTTWRTFDVESPYVLDAGTLEALATNQLEDLVNAGDSPALAALQGHHVPITVSVISAARRF